MQKEIELYDKTLLEKIIEETDKIMERFEDIPFGNSDVQNLYLIHQDNMSPARKYRTFGLKLQDRKRALEESMYSLRKTAIQLKKLRKKLHQEKDELERELIEIEIERTLNSLKYSKKLYNDCIREIEVLVNAIKKFPQYTREEFEQQEFEHFEKKLTHIVSGKPETLFSLQSLGIDVRIENGKLLTRKIEPEMDRIMKGELLKQVEHKQE